MQAASTPFDYHITAFNSDVDQATTTTTRSHDIDGESQQQGRPIKAPTR